MNIKTKKIINSFNLWRLKNISDKNFIYILSILTGIIGGIVVAIIKDSVHIVRNLLTGHFSIEYGNYMFIIYPAIGITLTVLFIRYVLRNWLGHGIPKVLYAISRKGGIMDTYNLYAYIIASALTVGFGGSVGLEGPTIATGASYGSNLARLFRLKYKDTVLLIGAASTAALAAIFKAPITGIIFVLEIMMIDLNFTSLLALLLASSTAVLTSYLIFGRDVIYPITVSYTMDYSNIPYYILLALISGIVSLYYFKVYVKINDFFKKFRTWYFRLPVGTILLGIIIFLFPALYGEGYESINSALNGDYIHLFEKSFYYGYHTNFDVVLLVLLAIVLLKVVAMTITFTAGGVGGDFAPTLFIGAHLGLLFALASNHFLGTNLNPTIFALLGMTGMISGVLHGPLTSMFLIAEVTSSYKMFLPLMIVSALTFLFVRIFNKYSIYTYQLAKRGELITHNKDKSALQLLEIEKLLETNFRAVKRNFTLGQLVKEFEKSTRNLFPVLDDEGKLEGIVVLEDIRKIMCKPEYYDKVLAEDVMVKLNEKEIVDIDEDNMEDVVNKFNITGNYNLPVVKDDKYLGFLSRANVLTSYRKLINLFSEE